MFKQKSLALFITPILLIGAMLLITPPLLAESRHHNRAETQQRQWNQHRNIATQESTQPQIDTTNSSQNRNQSQANPNREPRRNDSQRNVQPRSSDSQSKRPVRTDNRSHSNNSRRSEHRPSGQQVPRHESSSPKTWPQHDKKHKGDKTNKKHSLPANKKPKSSHNRYPKWQQSEPKFNQKPHHNNFAKKHRHSNRHRPNHHLYKRHKYVYFNTPWYNTWFLAPIPRHYHRHGYHVRVLPRNYLRLVVYGFPYFYYSGIYYRSFDSGYIVVAAPLGAAIKELPVGFIAFTIGDLDYYFVNETYYIWNDSQQAYVVVAKPTGADEAIKVATTDRLYIYPEKGQDENQQAKDRYECHRWAVTESGVDPSLEEQQFSLEENKEYKRAISACLEGRDYSVR